ncbi:HAD family hydrolase [Lentisphaera marina]|uniref:D-glycero-alpha-D-manno-heptose-1,7-bisphosphate 7-phosphatase n=1 Tax=Lentisphaera marina TaxID=1111041 RepID=UPI00236606BB|nr:HAD family hydrolase [Lentisphaera marina]MDD7984562.1 HAD family hydrolase [Lentisphaera marina]
MKTIFIDRDGCVNVRLVGNWVMNWNDFEFMPGAISGIAALKKAGYRLILVTNQRCINLGKFSEDKLDELHEQMQSSLKNEGGFFDKIYHCPHDRDENCGCRKPQPGMLLQAAKDFGDIELSQSIMLGDQESDRLASEAAGIKTFYEISEAQTIADAAKLILAP